jgi:sterol desaturase/sphingolipid hydroxylase (fatty acid hydroxylase superfamily)
MILLDTDQEEKLCIFNRIRQGKRRTGIKGGRNIEKWNRVTGYILLLIGVMTAWSSTQLSMGKFRHPGPGFLPFALAIILVFLALALILQNRKKGEVPAPFWPERTWLRPILGVAIFLLYAFSLGYLGFILTTFLFLVVWMWVIERVRWLTIMTLALGVTAVIYFIFEYFLEVPLPAGFWS